MVHDRVFGMSLGISVLFHLSAMTVFSIVILFPRDDLHYHTAQIVEPVSQSPDDLDAREVLRLRSPEEALKDLESSARNRDQRLVFDSLPEVELPRLEFSRLDRLRVEARGLELGRRLEGRPEPGPPDSWARFSGELESLGGAIARLTFGKGALPELTRPTLVTYPAAGFEAHIEWMTEPTDRQLTVAVPIEALWGKDPARIRESLVFILTVAPDGHVADVQGPVEDKSGIIASITEAVFKYRFEPLIGAGRRNQRGTLTITAEREER